MLIHKNEYERDAKAQYVRLYFIHLDGENLNPSLCDKLNGV